VFDRNELRVLPRDECIRLLATNELSLGRVAFVDQGRPVVLPVNYRVRDSAVIFRTDAGSKLDAATKGNWVALRSTRSTPGGGKAGASS
jgi:nitroimidazol reductase NimA-like FMN-containing flavoprotein (pyridoxamine 5'-phosphate oxidase superfamily)